MIAISDLLGSLTLLGWVSCIPSSKLVERMVGFHGKGG